MKLYYTERFQENLETAPPTVQRAFAKQARLLLENLRHPSLHAKKYNESQNIWQARVNKDWRFYFTIQDDAYLLRNILPHPKWVRTAPLEYWKGDF